MAYTALWLEDNRADVADFVGEIFRDLHTEVVFASSVAQARDIVQTRHIDLFLLDIEIADERVTGMELARWLRTLPAHYQTPVVFVSSYAHLARHLFASVSRCRLLTKPYTAQAFREAVGTALGLFEAVQSLPTEAFLYIPLKRQRTIEVDAYRIGYIEFFKDNTVRLQLNDGECITLECRRGVNKEILAQIEQNKLSHLKQIYRSIIVNIHEIKEVRVDGHEGYVRLFGDVTPKPLGSRYRENIRNFL